jgi:hypothetical protein
VISTYKLHRNKVQLDAYATMQNATSFLIHSR